MKKSNTSPYPIPAKEDPTFTSKVFGQQEYIGYKRPDNGGSSKLGEIFLQYLIFFQDSKIWDYSVSKETSLNKKWWLF